MAHQTLTRRMSRRPPRIPPHRYGRQGVLRHETGCKLNCHHEPQAHKILQVHLCDLRQDPALLRHELGREGEATSCKLNNHFHYF
jgi:hypothetical protein